MEMHSPMIYHAKIMTWPMPTVSSITEFESFERNILYKLFCLTAVSSQLISNIISQLMVTTNSVMQLHQRLKTTDDPSASGTRNKEMMKELENAVMMTQSMLTKITTNR